LRLYDFPGFGDPELPIEEIVSDIKITVKDQTFDAALIVIKSNDYRASA
jgi:hypothetical protein